MPASSDSNLFPIGDPGRAAQEVGQGAPSPYPESADYELSECVVPGAQVRAASVRGIQHRAERSPRQDRFSVVYDDASATLVITVCDGVGSLEFSHAAASFVARHIPDAYLRLRDWHRAVRDVNDDLSTFAATPYRGLYGRVRKPPMATTLAAAAIRFEQGRRVASVAWTDDTSVWLLRKGVWDQLTADEGEVGAIDTTQVRALPHRSPRVAVVERELTDGALFVTTDGVGKPLQDARQVKEALADWWATPPDAFTFARQVGFARKSHHDDRTAVGVWLDPA